MSVRLREIVGAHAVSERFDRVEMTRTQNFTTVQALAHADAIFDALAELPVRDRFALRVDIDHDAREFGALAQRQELREYIQKFHQDGESVGFRIEILKDVADQCLSVYSPAALGAYLESTSLSDALLALTKRFEGRLVFECFSGNPGKGTATLLFVNPGDVVPPPSAPLTYRGRALALLQENAFRTDNVGTLVPQDFAVRQPIGVPALDAFVARAGAALSAMFLSNFSELIEDRLTYRIAGYKLLSGTVDSLSDLVDASSTFQRIADWAYGAEGNSDKVGLARNVISLCVQRLEDVPKHPEIWDAIQSNYQIYLKENIATYLEVRNKLAELLAESTHKAHALVDGLLDSIRNGVLIVLTFLLTVVVINGLKDTGPKVIFSSEYLAIVWGLLGLSSLAIWASCRDARSRFDQGAAATRQLLKGMYAHVMLENEIDQHLEPTLTGNRGYLERQARKYLIFWLVLAGLIALSFLIGHWVFAKPDTPSSPTSMEASNVPGQVRPVPAATGTPQHAAEGQNAIGPRPLPQPPQAGKTAPVPASGALPVPGLSNSGASTDTPAKSTKPKTGTKQ